MNLLVLWAACSGPAVPVHPPMSLPPPAAAPDLIVPITSGLIPVAVGDVDGDGLDDLGLVQPKDDPLEAWSVAAFRGVAWTDGRPATTLADGAGIFASLTPGPVDVDGDGVHDIVTRSLSLSGCDEACSWGMRIPPWRPVDTGPDTMEVDTSGRRAASRGEGIDIDTASPCVATCDPRRTRFTVRYGGRPEVLEHTVDGRVDEHTLLDVDGDGDDDLVLRRGLVLAWLPSDGGVFRQAPLVWGAVDGLGLSGAPAEVQRADLLAPAGDVDGDGDEDLLVLASESGLLAADVALIPGGPAGPEAAPLWSYAGIMAPPSDPGILLARSVGDVDGDGFSDVHVDAAEGDPMVIHGGPAGLSRVMLLPRLLEPQAVGDFDGDGFDDVASLQGVFVGSPDGLRAWPRWPGMGRLAVGDVNGDGLDDTMSLMFTDTPTPGSAEVWVFFGRSQAGDSDGDGTPDPADCQPLDPTLGANVDEVAGNLIDEDCDGLWACLVDGDGDHHPGLPSVDLPMPCTEVVARPQLIDCDESNGQIHPGAIELTGNDVDEDCDGWLSCACDHDHDGWASATCTGRYPGPVCPAAVLQPPDCNDRDPLSHPGAPEPPGMLGDPACDGIWTCLLDLDRDGVGGTPVQQSVPCLDPGPVDCDDSDPAIVPYGEELPDNDVDEDCNGRFRCSVDADGDGWTTIVAGDRPCSQLPPVSGQPGDCDDGAAQVHPGLTELPGDWRATDEDCDGLVGCFVDADGDGYGSTATIGLPPGWDLWETDCGRQGHADNARDCDDGDRTIRPGVVDPAGDQVDGDCDGSDPFHLELQGPRQVALRGLPARARWVIAGSLQGPGPCAPFGPTCADLVSPRSLSSGVGGRASARLPGGGHGFVQGLAWVDGVVWRTEVLEVR